jgi:glucuronate isomerase
VPDLNLAAGERARDIARDLHAPAAGRPLICPHGHVDPGLIAGDRPFPDPAQLLVVPDHYVTPKRIFRLDGGAR